MPAIDLRTAAIVPPGLAPIRPSHIVRMRRRRRKIERSVAHDANAQAAPDIMRRKEPHAVIKAAIVPDHQVVVAPLVTVMKAWLLSEREEFRQKSVGALLRNAVDAQREAWRSVEA